MTSQEQLLEAAMQARESAYVPYSGFRVGAALLTDQDEIVTGGNIENAAYSVTNCAERTALFKAYSDGKKRYKMMAVVADSERPVPPCGACRQVMVELCEEEMPVILGNLKGEVTVTTVKDLLPGAFQAKDLKES